MSFKLAHITDLHMGPMVSFGPRYWSVKRLLGVLNWYRGRIKAHRLEVLEKIVADMLAQSPDHIAVTGDLVNIGLPDEHERALDWLRKLSPPDRVSVIPGNHDIYTNLGSDEGALRWRDYMSGEAWDRDAGDPNSGSINSATAGGEHDMFPYLRRLGPIALIGLNSAVPTKPFIAAGELGDAQRQRLAKMLALTAKQGLTRVVLIHHPPLPGQADAMRGLRDAGKLANVLAVQGAELVLHGHNHRNMLRWHPRSNGAGNGDSGAADTNVANDTSVPDNSVPVVGAPSASMARNHHGEPLARYNIFQFGSTGSEAGIEMIGRGLAEPGGKIVELERRMLHPGHLARTD